MSSRKPGSSDSARTLLRKVWGKMVFSASNPPRTTGSSHSVPLGRGVWAF